VVSVFFTLAGIAFLLSGKISFGLMMTVIFGACTTAIGYMIKVKNQQSA
jgi:hypothetical protein